MKRPIARTDLLADWAQLRPRTFKISLIRNSWKQLVHDDPWSVYISSWNAGVAWNAKRTTDPGELKSARRGSGAIAPRVVTGSITQLR